MAYVQEGGSRDCRLCHGLAQIDETVEAPPGSDYWPIPRYLFRFL
jgi:hypothetical protein